MPDARKCASWFSDLAACRGGESIRLCRIEQAEIPVNVRKLPMSRDFAPAAPGEKRFAPGAHRGQFSSMMTMGYVRFSDLPPLPPVKKNDTPKKSIKAAHVLKSADAHLREFSAGAAGPPCLSLARVIRAPAAR